MTPDGRLVALASAARRALAAEAVVLVEEPLDVEAFPLASVGVPDDDLQAIVAALAGAEDRLASTCGFRGLLRCDVTTAAGRRLSLCALRRDRGGFENIGLAPAFARHLDLACRPVPSETGEPPLLALFQRLSSAVAGAQGEDDAMRAIAGHTAAAVGATRAGVLVWDERERLLQLAPGSFAGGGRATAVIADTGVDWWSCAGRVFATGLPYATADATNDPGMLSDYVEHFGLRSVLTVPLEAGGRRIGVLQVADRPGGFGPAEVDAAEQLMPFVADALQRVRATFALRRRHRLEEILSGVAVDVAAGRSLQEFLAPALDDLLEGLRASTIAIRPAEGVAMTVRCGTADDHLERILLTDAGEATALRSHFAGPRRPGDAGWAALHVPVTIDADRVGTVSALRMEGRPFGRDERRALSRLAGLVALAWATEDYQRRRAALAVAGERDRIAGRLHDDAAQLLYAARIALEGIGTSTELSAAARGALAHAQDLIGRGDAAVRTVIHDLSARPAADLPARLAEVVGGVEDEFQRPVRLEITGDARGAAEELSGPAGALLARVTREALVNAVKHAGPCRLSVRVSVTSRHRLLLSITDDGIGRTRGKADGFGLAATRRAVRRHGGALRVHRGATGGTRVAVSLPL